jgi:hypothetical protein
MKKEFFAHDRESFKKMINEIAQLMKETIKKESLGVLYEGDSIKFTVETEYCPEDK